MYINYSVPPITSTRKKLRARNSEYNSSIQTVSQEHQVFTRWVAWAVMGNWGMDGKL